MITTQIHIADIHFGAIDPSIQYKILEEQFLSAISRIHFDILSVNGDLFDRKFMASSPAIYWATIFIHRCANLCKERNAALILISGTESHEAGQLSIFRDLESVIDTEIYVVEQAKFIHTHGLKILCLPEEYGKGYDYYSQFLSQEYDTCFMHGTLVGGVYGANKEDIDAKRPVFSLDSFCCCRGPIIAGHVHKAMCLNSYMYYVSNPIRYAFGEEEDKGYAIIVSNDTGHYYHFYPIESFRYDTIDIKDIISHDPNDIINKISALQASGIDYVRITISDIDDITLKTLSQYYSSNPTVKLDKSKINTSTKDNNPVVDTVQEILDKYSGMEFLLDGNLSEYDKLSRFIESSLGHSFIPIEELKSICRK